MMTDPALPHDAQLPDHNPRMPLESLYLKNKSEYLFLKLTPHRGPYVLFRDAVCRFFGMEKGMKTGG